MDAEERKKLRAKLRSRARQAREGGRGNSEMAQRFRNDPAGAFLAMGVDDATLLKNASSIVANPNKILQHMKDALPVSTSPTAPTPAADADDDDDEAPPQM